MKTRQILLAVATVMLLATSPVLLARDNDHHDRGRGPDWSVGDNGHHGRDGSGRNFQAPEIDAASGTSAIALLTGIVLLMKERRRFKRSSKSDE